MPAKRYWHGLGRWEDPMGFGCWQIAGEHYVDGKPHGWGRVEERDAIALVHAALDNGIRFFDTAAAYGEGRSEEILGEALSESTHGREAIICTKISPRFTPDLRALDLSFIGQVEDALRRLRRDRIDVLLLHNPPDAIDWKGFDRSLLDWLRERGRIASYGVSCVSFRGVVNVAEACFGTCVEWVLHLLERRMIDMLPRLQEAGIDFIARSPLSRGLFSAKRLHGPVTFGRSDFRSSLRADWIRWTMDAIGRLELSPREQENISRIALRYCLDLPGVSAVIPGIRTMDQLIAYLEITSGELMNEDFIARLNARTAPFFPPWG